MATAFAEEGPASGVTQVDSASVDLADLGLTADGILDSDLDGAPDSLENLLYGSDPDVWNSSGTPIPDGWLADHGFSPVDPGIARRSAPTPPAEALPETYANQWPARFTPSLLEIYQFGRPVDWDEATQGPFDNGIDARSWDQNGDGIPDGWLLHHGLDPFEDMEDRLLAGAEGLTVRQAFIHNTDPRRTDSDGDGLPDREEIAGPVDPTAPDQARFDPTDPSRSDTAGTGVCDGYLVHYGLDPNLPAPSLGDGDRDGATTKEEFAWSLDRFGPETCTHGAGLDPTSASSGGAPIPDGWLIAHDLDPFEEGIATQVTQRSDEDLRPAGVPSPAAKSELTVTDEYAFDRPPQWSESRDGPWWGGTDPRDADTDGDGLGDAWEIAGYTLHVATEPGPGSAKNYVSTLDPTRADTDRDGTSDLDEVLAGTDGRRQDTDFDGLGDRFEIVHPLLNASRADSAGDHLRDGERLTLLEDLAKRYAEDTTYLCPGECLLADVTDWLENMPGARGLGSLSASQIADLVGPEGNLNGRVDADGSPIPNVIDPDIDGDGIINGAEVHPELYAETHFGLGPLGKRSATDPINPDTDGDGLPDGWEVRHGRVVGGVQSLDPALWDSDGNGVDDGGEDPDGDSIWWHDLTSPDNVARKHFAFDNRQEFSFGTDPHDATSDGDGLLDGWKVFWSLRYPDLDGVPASAPRPVLGTPQPIDEGASIISETPYWRWSDGDTEDGEQKGATVTVQTGSGQFQLTNVTGHASFRFHDAQRLETNPYLFDTDGDGMPDWWEDRNGRVPAGLSPGRGQCGGVGPDPVWPDAGDDPDEDGVSNGDEFARGGHPLCKDSDMAGVPDGDEVERNLHPGDPRDDVKLQDDTLDTDGDGLSDFEEITQTLTSFLHPDTDGDGLLDGGHRPAQGCWQGDDPKSQRFLDLGMAYRMPEDDCYQFLGEANSAIGTDPRDGDDFGIGVPAGWIFMKMPDFTPSAAEAAQEHYALGRPHWWQEDHHGVWWGGADPQAGERDDIPSNEMLANLRHSLDLDGDGLLDRDATGAPAEDPLPTGNAQNQPRSVQDLPEDTDPRTSGDPILRRLAAQATLDPAPYSFPNARNTIPHPAYNADQDPRSEPCIELTQAPDEILKGDAATVEGLLLSCDSQAGVEGVAVQAIVSGQIFGAGFTDAAGSFEIPVDISSTQRSLDIPAAAASAFRGNLSGSVSWMPDASAVAPGDQTLVVRSYATAGLQRAQTTSDLLVEATSVLLMEAPEDASTGKDVPLRLRLEDSGGTPLRHPVQVTWDGETLGPFTPRVDDGGIDVQLPAIAHADAGPIRLTAASSPPADDATTPADAATDVHVRRTGILEIHEPEGVVAGEAVAVRGEFRSVFGVGASSQRGEPGATVTAVLVHGSDLAPVSDTTGAGGRFEIFVPLDDGLSAGTYTISVSASRTTTATGTQTDALVAVQSLPAFIEVTSEPLEVGQAHEVAGRLVQPDGSPIADAPVDLWLGDSQASARTLDDGRFRATLDAVLRPGPVEQTLDFSGDHLYAAAHHRVERSVLSATYLEVPDGDLARGASASIPIQLTDGNGEGVEGAVLEVAWGTEEVRSALTDEDGVAVFTRPGSVDDALGTVTVEAVYAGSAGSALAPSQASAAWAVRAQIDLMLPAAALAGAGGPAGTLIDAGTGSPLAQREVEVTVDGQPRAAMTDSDGRFPLLAVAPPIDTDPQTLAIQVSFAGDHEYPAAERTTTLRIRSPVTMHAEAPDILVTGQEAIVHASLRDGRGAPAEGGSVEVHVDDVLVGSAPAHGGTVSISVRPPLAHPAGKGLLHFHYIGSQTHGPAEETLETQFVQGAQMVLDAHRAHSGGVTTLRVQLLAGDAPVADHPIHLFVEGMPSGLEATTDSDGVASFRFKQASDTMTFMVRAPGTATFSPTASAGTVEALPPLISKESAFRALPWALAGGVVLVMAAAALVRHRLRKPLSQAFQRARSALQARGPDEKKILEAYLILEDEAIALELMSEPANTPRGLQKVLQRVLPSGARGPLDRLIGLFEVARYSAHVVGAEQRSQAMECLAAIQHALQAGVPDDWEVAS